MVEIFASFIITAVTYEVQVIQRIVYRFILRNDRGVIHALSETWGGWSDPASH